MIMHTILSTPGECLTWATLYRSRPINWGYYRSQRYVGDVADKGKEIQLDDYVITATSAA